MVTEFNTIAIQSLTSFLTLKEAGLALGMTFGIKEYISPELYEQMKIIGATHLLVLSGANISLFAEFIERTLFFVRSHLRKILVLSLITLLALVVPLQGSVVRALIMFTIPQIGLLFGKKSHSLYLLFFTAIVMLIYNINYLNDISFQLSFTALFGIILFDSNSKDISNPKNIPSWFLESIKSQLKLGLCAQTFTLPLIFYYFNTISLMGIVSTILINIAVVPIMVLTTLSIVITNVMPGGQKILGYLLSPTIWFVLTIANRLSELKLLYITY